MSKNRGISSRKILSYFRKGKKNCFLGVEKKKHPEGKKKKEKEEMQKKLRKENLPFVMASADRGSSCQPPIGRTLELGLRRSVTSLLPHARAYCERRDEFLRVCYVVASRVSIFLTFCPPSFLPTSHVPCFLQINGFLGLIYCLVFLGWLASPGERERERELSRAREILCAEKNRKVNSL